MTLEEYLNQEDPKRHQIVWLKANEFHLGVSFGGYTNIFLELVLSGKRYRYEYLKPNESTTLYATDNQGNPKVPSVFHIHEDEMVKAFIRKNQLNINKIPVHDFETVNPN